jgi:hypothetical protein
MSETQKRIVAPEDRDATRKLLEEMRKRSPFFRALKNVTDGR